MQHACAFETRPIKIGKDGVAQIWNSFTENDVRSIQGSAHDPIMFEDKIFILIEGWDCQNCHRSEAGSPGESKRSSSYPTAAGAQRHAGLCAIALRPRFSRLFGSGEPKEIRTLTPRFASNDSLSRANVINDQIKQIDGREANRYFVPT